MITKKQAAGLAALILGSVVATLKTCDDNTPLVPGVAVVAPVVGDAGVLHQSAE